MVKYRKRESEETEQICQSAMGSPHSKAFESAFEYQIQHKIKKALALKQDIQVEPCLTDLLPWKRDQRKQKQDAP